MEKKPFTPASANITAFSKGKLSIKEVIKISCIYSGSLRHGQLLIGDRPKLNCIYFVHCQNVVNIRHQIVDGCEFATYIRLKDKDIVIL